MRFNAVLETIHMTLSRPTPAPAECVRVVQPTARRIQMTDQSKRVQAMTDADDHELGLLPKVVIVVAVALFVTGALWHGVSLKTIEQFWHDLIERPDGPMRFRFVLQPSMATIVAIRDGLKDVRSGRTPYFAAVLGNPSKRAGPLREGLNATARIISLGLVMDVIYQAIVFKTFYPDQALVVALVLAFVPYLIVRDVTVRVWRGHSSG